MGECTVICTIHQPQQKIFELFDNLILMKQGTIVYQGSAYKSLRYFENLGQPVPVGENPADHILTIIAPTAEELAKNGASTNFTVPIDLSLGIEKPMFVNEDGISWFAQFSILFQRNIHTWLRRYDIIFMNLIVCLLLATFISQGIWKTIGSNQHSLLTRGPSLFFACVTQGIVASLQTVNNFPAERAIVLRERAAGSYHVSAYFLARTVSDICSQIWPPILFTCIVYPQIGYQQDAKKFMIYMMFMILDTLAATSVSAAVSCICVTVEMSTVVLAGIFEVSRLYGGFFTSPAQLLEYKEWKFADALSYIKYAFVGVAINEFSGLDLRCTDAQVEAGTCISQGETIMEQKGYDQYTIQFAAGMLVVYIICCRIIAFLALRFLKN
jgi:ATP-binding cassette subfamily G (WHITE) protein 2